MKGMKGWETISWGVERGFTGPAKLIEGWILG